MSTTKPSGAGHSQAAQSSEGLDPVCGDWSWLDRIQAEFAAGLDADAVEATTANVAQQARTTLDEPFL